MKYSNIIEGTFLSRPNRFVAIVEINGKKEICHVKNTGRCKELLLPGVKVFVEKAGNPLRKTQFDLVAVSKDERLFNIDSQAPNKVFGEWLESSGYFKNISKLRPETKFSNSRFDFYFEYNGKKAFAEVKGVTLEKNGVFLFPDAPTERGVKHLQELKSCIKEGYEAYVAFVIQADGAEYFTPNRETHNEFAEALISAKESGVRILCLDCLLTPDTIDIKGFVPCKL